MMGPYNTLLAPTCLARKEFSRAQRSPEWQLFSFEARKRVLDPEEQLGFTYGYDSLCGCMELNLHPIRTAHTVNHPSHLYSPQPLFETRSHIAQYLQR
ncbi:hypothetical protein LEMLEM_LOCUS27140 [Lemmus lemmus]